MKTRTRTWRSIWILPLAVFLIAGAAISRADENPEPRINSTSQGPGTQRGAIAGADVTTDEFSALVTAGDKRQSLRSRDQQKLSGLTSKTPNTDFWFFDVDVQLFSDLDQDGYYYGIDLLFDADTIYSVADVYAVVYLSLDFGPWNEYASTEDFTLFGASASDEYVVVSELVSGYPTGDYDILIELFDAFDGTFVASIGPEDTSKLSFLPLEDANRDAPFVEPQIVVNRGGGGSMGLFSLLALLGLTAWTRYVRRNF